MKKLVDVDDIREAVRSATSSYLKDPVLSKSCLEFMLDRIPEAIVRCKDCRYWNTGDAVPNRGVARCDLYSEPDLRLLRYTDWDDFCSNGKMRGND